MQRSCRWLPSERKKEWTLFNPLFVSHLLANFTHNHLLLFLCVTFFSEASLCFGRQPSVDRWLAKKHWNSPLCPLVHQTWLCINCPPAGTSGGFCKKDLNNRRQFIWLVGWLDSSFLSLFENGVLVFLITFISCLSCKKPKVAFLIPPPLWLPPSQACEIDDVKKASNCFKVTT